jgi:hypothetical protein
MPWLLGLELSDMSEGLHDELVRDPMLDLFVLLEREELIIHLIDLAVKTCEIRCCLIIKGKLVFIESFLLRIKGELILIEYLLILIEYLLILIEGFLFSDEASEESEHLIEFLIGSHR